MATGRNGVCGHFFMSANRMFRRSVLQFAFDGILDVCLKGIQYGANRQIGLLAARRGAVPNGWRYSLIDRRYLRNKKIPAACAIAIAADILRLSAIAEKPISSAYVCVLGRGRESASLEGSANQFSTMQW